MCHPCPGLQPPLHGSTKVGPGRLCRGSLNHSWNHMLLFFSIGTTPKDCFRWCWEEDLFAPPMVSATKTMAQTWDPARFLAALWLNHFFVVFKNIQVPQKLKNGVEAPKTKLLEKPIELSSWGTVRQVLSFQTLASSGLQLCGTCAVLRHFVYRKFLYIHVYLFTFTVYTYIASIGYLGNDYRLFLGHNKGQHQLPQQTGLWSHWLSHSVWQFVQLSHYVWQTRTSLTKSIGGTAMLRHAVWTRQRRAPTWAPQWPNTWQAHARNITWFKQTLSHSARPASGLDMSWCSGEGFG